MYCCVKCFSLQKIKNFIIDFDEKGECDYCESKEVYIAPVNDVGSFVMEGIDRAYEDPAEQVGYDSREGGYLLPTTDIYDVLIDELAIFSDELYDPQMLLNSLVSDPLTPLIQRDPYGPPRGYSDESYRWKSFCKLVKTKRRFTAFIPDEEDKHSNTPQPIDLMKGIIADLSFEHFSVINKGDKIFRARMEKTDHTFSHEELTSPPSRIARNNRMSPAGISLFYGALVPKTCISELRPSVGERVVVAEFKAAKDLIVIDLSGKIAEEPSIFDENFSIGYERWVSFIKDFSEDISKPIRPMDQEIDYIPTQVFTEFLRHYNFKDIFYSGKPGEEKLTFIEGLKFSSSLHEGGTNVVLFRGPEISIKNSDDKTWLEFQDSKTHEVTKVLVEADFTSEHKQTGTNNVR